MHYVCIMLFIVFVFTIFFSGYRKERNDAISKGIKLFTILWILKKHMKSISLNSVRALIT